MLDKSRATLAGKSGDYLYNATFDGPLVQFLAFDPDVMLKELATGKGDGEMLDWVQSHAKTPRALWKIEDWSAFVEKRGPDGHEKGIAFLPNIWVYIPKPANASRPGLKPLNLMTTPALEEKPRSRANKRQRSIKSNRNGLEPHPLSAAAGIGIYGDNRTCDNGANEIFIE
jgi:hypothetical protein